MIKKLETLLKIVVADAKLGNKEAKEIISVLNTMKSQDIKNNI